MTGWGYWSTISQGWMEERREGGCGRCRMVDKDAGRVAFPPAMQFFFFFFFHIPVPGTWYHEGRLLR